MRNCLRVLAFSAVTSAILFAPAPAAAQQDVEVASKAFAEGQQAQLRGDPVRAAELFEIADQSVPSPAALRSAIRNREAAGHDVRAATLSLRAIERYGQDRDTRAFAEEVLARLGPKLGRVRLRCSESCTATADGGLIGSGLALEFFETPGPHTLNASWSGRPSVSRAVDLTAAQTLDVEFVAPPPDAVAAPALPAQTAPAPAAGSPANTSGMTLSTASGDPMSDSRGGGMSPAVFWIGAGLTAVSGGLLIWSGLDTLSANEDYEGNPTRSGFDDGVDKERRTNILIGTTAVLGVATVAVGLFATDWGGSSGVSLDAGPSHARLSWTGVLP